MEKRFYRDTWVEVDLQSIYENVQNVKQYLPSDVDIIAVVKANAYGHGAVPVAQTALRAGASCLAVALLDEALELRAAGIEAPILVLGWTRPEDVRIAANHQITLTVFQREWLQSALLHLPKEEEVCFHLKVDTGMGRIGIRERSELDGIIDILQQYQQFKMTGVFTHFATADEEDPTYFEMQYHRFLTCLNWLKNRNMKVPTIHCANSATTLRFPHHSFNAVRYGISMYGLSPSPFIKKQLPFPLKEAFSLKTKVVHVKQVELGEKIGYGGTYETKKKEWIGTLPIGYADGWVRKLKTAQVLVNGKRCPIVGRICMDQMMIRLPERVAIGTEVTLIGEQGDEKITIDEIANLLDTINYEIPCMITSRVPRTYLPFSSNERYME